MFYLINRQNIKKSIAGVGAYCKDSGLSLKHHHLLEIASRLFGFKNYSTLEGMVGKPHVIEHLPVTRKYLFEIDATISKDKLLALLNESFKKAQATLNLNTILVQTGDINSFHLELHVSNSDNVLTAMFLLATQLKPHGVKRFDYCRVFIEKESFMDFYKNP